MKRSYSQAQPAMKDQDDDMVHWEHVRAPRQRFECLKCEPHRTTFYGFGDDHNGSRDSMDC